MAASALPRVSAAPFARASSPLAEPGEQRFVIHGVPWKTYVLLREAIDEPGLRMTYCEGALELMSPGPEHENRKTLIARLLELWALEIDVPLQGYGSTTFRREAKERGAEPDECYCVGALLQDVPDIAIEVVITSGGLDKLHVYEGLEVREVWLFRGDDLEVHELRAPRGSGYARIPRSNLLPKLDIAALVRFAREDDQHAAVKAYRAWLKRAPTKPRRRGKG